MGGSAKPAPKGKKFIAGRALTNKDSV